MRYLISTILLMIALFLSILVAYCVYMAVSDNWVWSLVGVGILLPDIVAILALSAAIPSAKEY